MSKEEKIDELNEHSINELYIKTKIMLEARKELEGGESDEVEK